MSNKRLDQIRSSAGSALNMNSVKSSNDDLSLQRAQQKVYEDLGFSKDHPEDDDFGDDGAHVLKHKFDQSLRNS